MDNDHTIPSQLPPMTIPSTLGPASGYSVRESKPSDGSAGLFKLVLLVAFVGLVVYLTR